MDHGNAEARAPGPDMAESTPPPAPTAPQSTAPPPAPPPPAQVPLASAPPPPAPARGAHEPRSDRIGPTRLSGAWTAAVVAIVFVVAMLIFILQNGRQVPINFVSVHGHLPLGVAMLFSAVIGAVIVVGCGTARILQLRRVAKRRSRAVPSQSMASVLAPQPAAGPVVAPAPVLATQPGTGPAVTSLPPPGGPADTSLPPPDGPA